MASPLELLIDRATFKCSLCLRLKGDPQCRCWVKYRCGGCGATTHDDRRRISTDCGFEVTEDEIVTLCPKCKPESEPDNG